MNHIPHNKPCIGNEESKAVTRVLRNQWLISGEEVSTFERTFACYIGADFAVAVTSGTAALHLSLLSLGVQNGDEVILPTYTASDLLNAIHYVGAIPILVDIAANSCAVDIAKIPQYITRKTKVMIIPHTFGLPTDIPQLYQYEIPIIEDCAQTIGSELHGKKVGTFGTISIFSFFATKLLTTGQGGMVVTNDQKIHDVIADAIDYNGRDNYKIRYNYPMTDIAAGIGNVQLAKYPLFSARRKEIARRYQEVLEKKQIIHYPKKEETHVIPFRFLIQCSHTETVAIVQKKLTSFGIEAKLPIAPYELLHNLLQQDASPFPNAEYFAKTVLSLPIYPCLSDSDIDYIVEALSKL